MRLRSAYADVRGWDATKWAQYPELSESMITDGRSGLLIDGTADGLMRQLGDKLGLPTGSAPAAGATASERPPIVFDQAAQLALPTAPQAVAPAEDSLLSRLSRQLQSGSGGTTTPTLDQRPLQRAAPGTQAAPMQPAYSPPQPPLGNERAEGEAPPFVDADFPSIHSAAMQRVTTDLGVPTGAVDSLFQSPTDAAGADQGLFSRLQETATGQVPELDWSRPLTRELTPSPTGSSETGFRPLDIDAARLQQQLPSVIQQNLLRSLQPSAAAPPPTIKAF